MLKHKTPLVLVRLSEVYPFSFNHAGTLLICERLVGIERYRMSGILVRQVFIISEPNNAIVRCVQSTPRLPRAGYLGHGRAVNLFGLDDFIRSRGNIALIRDARRTIVRLLATTLLGAGGQHAQREGNSQHSDHRSETGSCHVYHPRKPRQGFTAVQHGKAPRLSTTASRS